jgi:hypothetical protein
MFPIEVIEAAAYGGSPSAEIASNPTLLRDFEILSRRFRGETLDAIGEKFGLTRERARQIITARSGREFNKYKLLIAANEKSLKDNEVQRICSFISARPGVDWEEVLEHFPNTKLHKKDLPTKTAKIVRTLRKSALAGERLWTESEVLKAIAEAGTYYFPLGKTNYDFLLSKGAIKGPSSSSIMVRFRSWSNACELAGVECFTPKTHYSKSWSDNELIQFVVAFILSDSDSTSMGQYDLWRLSQVNETPSSALIRITFDGWSDTLSIAFETLRSTWRNLEE